MCTTMVNTGYTYDRYTDGWIRGSTVGWIISHRALSAEHSSHRKVCLRTQDQKFVNSIKKDLTLEGSADILFITLQQ